jgi:membrane-associated protein
MIDISPEKIIQTGGALLVGGIIFAESAFLIGIIMPGGDTLLFMAGFFASQGLLQLHWLILFIIIGAVLGDNVGYTIGRRAGPRLFRKDDGLFFRKDHIERAATFYETHGGKTVTLARFVPVVRTFAPMIAGVAKMDRRQFMFYNVLGAVVWATSVPLLGYFFGSKIPNIDQYLGPIVLVAFVLTFIPPLIPIMRDPVARKALFAHLDKLRRNVLRHIGLNKRP